MADIGEAVPLSKVLQKYLLVQNGIAGSSPQSLGTRKTGASQLAEPVNAGLHFGPRAELSAALFLQWNPQYARAVDISDKTERDVFLILRDFDELRKSWQNIWYCQGVCAILFDTCAIAGIGWQNPTKVPSV